MKIILDDSTLDQSPATIAEAISAAADHAAANGRVVVDIFADGRAVTMAELDDAEAMASACDELRLTTAEPRSFVAVTMRDAADALTSARLDQQSAAESLEAGSTEEAFKAMDRALNVWQAARQSLDQGAQLLGLDLSTLPLGDAETLPGAIAKLSAALEEVRRSVGAQDWASLSDVLLYDLDDLVGQWQGILRETADHISTTE